MNEAIKLAIKDGYNFSQYDVDIGNFHEEVISRDPLFWQALGKALGWKVDKDDTCINNECFYCKPWLKHAHRYLDIVLIGGDTEKFWKELLTN
jgi:hypothetical protein